MRYSNLTLSNSWRKYGSGPRTLAVDRHGGPGRYNPRPAEYATGLMQWNTTWLSPTNRVRWGTMPASAEQKGAVQ